MFWILTYLQYIMTFHLACLLTFKTSRSGICSDSLCHFAIGIVGGILCGISSDLPTGIPSDTLASFRRILWHTLLLWHVFCLYLWLRARASAVSITARAHHQHIFWHSIWRIF